MNKTHIIATLLLSTVCASSLIADTVNKPTPIDRGKNFTAEQRGKMLKKFDRDRNGKIDGKGKVAAKKALKGRKAGKR